jgi:hypothetical protein
VLRDAGESGEGGCGLLGVVVGGHGREPSGDLPGGPRRGGGGGRAPPAPPAAEEEEEEEEQYEERLA